MKNKIFGVLIGSATLLSVQVFANDFPIQIAQFGALQNMFGARSSGAVQVDAVQIQQYSSEITALERAGRFEEAIVVADRAIAEISKNPMAMISRQATGTGPDQQFKISRLKLLVAINRKDEAVQAFRKIVTDISTSALGRNPNVAVMSALSTTRELANALKLKGQLQDAYDTYDFVRDVYGAAKSNDPLVKQMVFKPLGEISEQMGQLQKAEDHYLVALDGVETIYKQESKKSTGYAAVVAAFGAMKNTSRSIIQSTFDDFDAPVWNVKSQRTGGMQDDQGDAPIQLMKNATRVSYQLGHHDFIEHLFTDIYPKYLAGLENSSSSASPDGMVIGPGGELGPAMTKYSLDIVTLLRTFGDAFVGMGKLEKARQAYTDSFERAKKGMSVFANGFGSPRASFAYYESAAYCLGQLVRLSDSTDFQQLNNLANQWILLKGSIYEQLTLINRIQLESTDPKAKELVANYRKKHEAAEKALLSSDEMSPPILLALNGYYSAKQSLALYIAPTLQHESAKRLDNVPVTKELGELPRQIAVIDFIKVDQVQNLSTQYWAFVYRAGESPALVKMAEGNAIELLVASYRNEISRASEGVIPSQSMLLDLGEKLGKVVWQPLQSHLSGVQKVIISTDGALSMVPFETLRIQGKYLLELVELESVNSLRDLVRRQTSASTGPVVLLGNPAFGEASRNRAAGMPVFESLPGTKTEVSSIADLVRKISKRPVSLLTEETATKERLNSIQSPSVLHLASHGYFLTKEDWKAIASQQRDVDQSTRSGSGILLMKRSGIALAGVNQGDLRDGILSMDDITRLDLRSTDLVVLSACETALGDLKSGEGIRGLRSSFQMAGAKNVISTLWVVPDQETSKMMQSFYGAYLSKSTPSESLRKAKLEIIKVQPNPFYWGAFVLNTSR
jgi:CHAT domain-containing protein/tetratricopeptide (TPR) repeat protein